jgi:AP-4 complex subunit mu-1
MDDCNFHECANTTQFDIEKILVFSPPEGEFTLMNYRISSEFRVPFRLLPFVEEVGPNRIDVIVKVFSLLVC